VQLEQAKVPVQMAKQPAIAIVGRQPVPHEGDAVVPSPVS
jgi:hypothetical protein